MMLDWNEYQKELGARIGELAKLSPDTVRGYQTLSAANSKSGKLDEKTRQLISLAIAVTTRCDGCITFHSEAAQSRSDKGRNFRSLGRSCGDERRRSARLLDPCAGRGRRSYRESTGRLIRVTWSSRSATSFSLPSKLSQLWLASAESHPQPAFCWLWECLAWQRHASSGPR